MNNRYILPLATGAAVWAFCALAAAQTPVYFEDFEAPTTLADLTEAGWSFGEVFSGFPLLLSTAPAAPLQPTRFLGEFGGNDAGAPGAGDIVYLNLDLPQDTVEVRLRFDAYLLRTWDGDGAEWSGPDIFGYGINGQSEPLLRDSFNNGAGYQTYCPDSPTPKQCAPTWGSDPVWKDKLGFDSQTVPGDEKPMSLVYHFDSGVIPYSSGGVTFKFFSENLQVRADLANHVADESWGLDNVRVTATVVPEPQTFALLLAGLLLLSFTAHRRGRFPR